MQDNISIKPNTPEKLFRYFCIAVFTLMLLFSGRNIYAVNLTECLMEVLNSADDSVTVGQLREQCQEETGTISRDKLPDNSAVKMNSMGPTEMVLQTVQAKKAAFFPHKIHQDKYTCGTCHHGQDSAGKMVKYDDKTEIHKCTSCHNTEMANEELNGFQLIGHALCRECHRMHQDITSATCSTCHRRRS